MINIGAVLNIISVLIMLLGTFMLVALGFSLDDPKGTQIAIFYSSFSTIIAGGILFFVTKHFHKKIGKREGYLVVALGWATVATFSSLPYWFSGVLPEITNAIFESVSGLTTTGASVINDIEAVPQAVLFWRSLTQWIGGMGIIVLTVAIFPMLGIGGVELFVAEAPGPTSDKIHPRIKETAKRLWFIYVGLTTLLMIILWAAGMTLFDAVNHALTTMSTGGFSTKNASIAHYESPLIQYPIILFMFLGGINYTVIYYSLIGKFKKVWRSDEFKTYVLFVGTLILLVTSMVYYNTDHGLEQSFRDSAFMLISVITTTGFVSADYTSWTPALTLLFFALLFVGGCAGSTSGGIKVIRHLVFFKNSLLEFKRLLHPRALIRIKIDQQLVPPRVLTHILVFLLLYLIIFVTGSFLMSVILSDFDQPFITAIGATATALGNVGPAIGELGPVDNFAAVPMLGKWLLVGLMLLGRLELFTILILFSPYFWRMN
ncbi:MAG: TrkH family potassium uptake protein [Saprospiraceae bacterium]